MKNVNRTINTEKMKKIYSLILLLAAPMLLLAQGITFEHGTLEQALAKAKAESKLVFIDGYAVWCGPCKHMAKTVFLEDTVGKYFDENFVALKVDVERGEGPEIKRKYGISGLPGYVFLDGDGVVVYRFEASMPTEKFMKEVALAVAYGKDPNSAGRLAERYSQEKDNEQFVRMYLDKLKEAKSTGYTDIVEHYLDIQTTMPEASKEMVTFLADHSGELIFGGKADEIIQRNNGSDAWKLWVRKDIREIFQKLPRSMVESTTDYAILKRDTTILEYVLTRASEAGASVDEAQRKRLYIFYYEKSEQGEKYKALVHDDNEAYIQSLDVAKLRADYEENLRLRAEGDSRALYSHPYAIRNSTQIYSMVFAYSKFVTTEQDKADVVRWMKAAYDMIPGDATVMSQYANILYKFGGDQEQAIKIAEEAYEIAQKEDMKRGVSIKADLDLMKEGKEINLS
ncbi:thioredoxin-like protein [Mangrovibacterium diazotrophicum]|uniref:Thioredoxin-like protein n=2 Tax=Mangrovibacterium diazotrophicum TaxID=1261403 RepID=A0A419W649_9BACT|nr:thioredoxin-like protein [Mangrovibacterium diazotrophicum]